MQKVEIINKSSIWQWNYSFPGRKNLSCRYRHGFGIHKSKNRWKYRTVSQIEVLIILYGYFIWIILWIFLYLNYAKKCVCEIVKSGKCSNKAYQVRSDSFGGQNEHPCHCTKPSLRQVFQIMFRARLSIGSSSMSHRSANDNLNLKSLPLYNFKKGILIEWKIKLKFIIHLVNGLR